MDENNGKWVTIKGRHIFLKDGQSVSDAINEYETYKKAKETPEEITPMEENSTDFESLNNIYGDKEDITEEEKGQKINETMNKREEIIKKLDEQTKDLESYDKYNLAVSKLESTEDMTPTERQYWVGERERFLKSQKENEENLKSQMVVKGMTEDHTFDMSDEDKQKYEEVGNKIDALTRELEENESYPQSVGSPSFEDMGLNVDDKKGFSEYLRDSYGTDDFRVINFENKEGAKGIYEDYQKKTYNGRDKYY